MLSQFWSSFPSSDSESQRPERAPGSVLDWHDNGIPVAAELVLSEIRAGLTPREHETCADGIGHADAVATTDADGGGVTVGNALAE